jgi:hypothetical protein
MDRHEEKAFHAYLLDSQFKSQLMLPHHDPLHNEGYTECVPTLEEDEWKGYFPDGDESEATSDDELPLERPVLIRQPAEDPVETYVARMGKIPRITLDDDFLLPPRGSFS